MSNENRTFGIALNIYYKDNSSPETHYQEFNANIGKEQTVSLSVYPENENEEIDYLAFAFVYGCNENTMTVYNASLNILDTGYSAESTTDSSEGTTEDESSGTSEAEEDNYIDYEVVSETLDNSQPYMETSTAYDNTSNYAVSETDEAGNTVTYTYDLFGKIIDQTDTTVYNIANINPFRYRGYAYDEETGLYYLKSRYYDPETGRFINADIYCDTMSNIFGTNMFTYCNNNPVNQIDPEGTDAIWLQFSNGANGFGHTSLLLQDSVNNWWYFYWGPKQAILRPCGKDDFSMAELNSYLAGFDPRPGHNYYVYATNVFNDSEDTGYSNGNSTYYVKCHDGIMTHWFSFQGGFSKSFKYAKDLLTKLYSWSNANQLYETVYENGKKIDIYNVCDKTYYPYTGSAHRYYYKDLKSNNESVVRSYDGLSYNCVQVSMEILLKGDFNEDNNIYKKRIESIIGKPGGIWPNNAFDFVRFG